MFDERVKTVPVGCGKCIECRKQKAREWKLRLLEDIKYHPDCKFVTLTFSNENLKKLEIEVGEEVIKNLEKIRKNATNLTAKRQNYLETKEIQKLEGYALDNATATIAVKRWRERWRKKYKKTIRHWLVTELGHKNTERLHLHGIVWSKDLEEVERIWQYGHVWKGEERNGKLINYVNNETINYCTKYVMKMDADHPMYKSKILTSPGIGADYIKSLEAKKHKFAESDTIEYYETEEGHRIAMPIYWRNKLYTESEREALWLHKLDKNERYICGEKINLNEKNISEYYKLLDYHRKRNATLGYGDDKKQWEQQAYEQTRRNLMRAKRK